MPHLFDRRDWFGNSPAVWVLAAMLFVTPLVWQNLQQVRIDHDAESWLPCDTAHPLAFERSPLSVSGNDRLLISWEGSSLGDPRIDVLQQKLEPVHDKDGVPRGGLPHIASVVDPRELLVTMQQNEVPPQEAVRRLQGVLIGAGPLRVRLTEAGRAHLRRMQLELPDAAQRALGLRLDVGPADASLGATALIPGIADENGAIADSSPPAVLSPSGELEDGRMEHDLSITWSGIGVGRPQTMQIVEWLARYRGASDAVATPLVDRSFFVAGDPVALCVQLSEAGLADPSEALRLIRLAAADAGIPNDKLRLAGSAAVDVGLDRAAATAVWNPAVPWTQLQSRSALLASTFAAAVLAFVMLGSLRLATVAVFAAGFSACLSLALIPATGGTLNLLSITIPVLIGAMTLSLSVRIANSWNHTASTNPRTTAVEVCRAATWPCLFATATLTIGLASLGISSVAPIREFGLYAAAGAVLSLPILLFGVPSLLMLWKGASGGTEVADRPGWRAFFRILLHRPGLQVLTVLAACGAAAFGLARVRVSPEPIHCLADSSSVLMDARQIEDHLSGLMSVEAIVRFDPAAQDEASFLDRMELVRAIEEKLRKHPDITGCLALADYHPPAEPPEDGASMLARNRYLKRANLLQDRIRSGEIQEAATFYALAGGGDDPHDRNDELWRIMARTDFLAEADGSAVLRDVNEIAQAVLRFQPGAGHAIAGDLTGIVRAEQAMRASCVWCLAIASGLILLVLIVGSKSVCGGLMGMIPGMASITAVLGARSWLGIPIDFGSVLAVPIALGLAAHGSLQLLIEMRRRIAECRTRQEAIAASLETCGPATVQSSLIAALAFGMLVPAESPTIGAFGTALTAMVAAALFGNIVVLPQLFVSPVGWLAVSSVKSGPNASGDAISSKDGDFDEPHEPPWETAA